MFRKPKTEVIIRTGPVSTYEPRHLLDGPSLSHNVHDNLGLHRFERTCKGRGHEYGSCCPFSGNLSRALDAAEMAEWEHDLLGSDPRVLDAQMSEMREVAWVMWEFDFAGRLVYAVPGTEA